MYVLANPVLSKMYAHSGLTLNETGLHYFLTENPTFYFTITKDHVKIAEVMGFNYEEFEAAKEYKDFFKLLLTNKYFRPSRFIEDTTEGRNKMLKELAEFLKEHPERKGYTTRQISDMFEPLKEFNFEERYNRVQELYKNRTAIHQKFNGQTVLRCVPGYDKRNLEHGFIKWNGEHFKSHIDRVEFIYSHSEQEIVEEYLRATT